MRLLITLKWDSKITVINIYAFERTERTECQSAKMHMGKCLWSLPPLHHFQCIFTASEVSNWDRQSANGWFFLTSITFTFVSKVIICFERCLVDETIVRAIRLDCIWERSLKNYRLSRNKIQPCWCPHSLLLDRTNIWINAGKCAGAIVTLHFWNKQ